VLALRRVLANQEEARGEKIRLVVGDVAGKRPLCESIHAATSAEFME
jgi:hypothetical protein